MPNDAAPTSILQAFRFPDLPAELRNKIYRLVLADKKFATPFYFKSVHGFIRYDKLEPSFEQQPAVTKVSRQIRSEALPLYYGYRKFFMDLTDDSFSMFKAWIGIVRESALRHLQNIVVVLHIKIKQTIKCDWIGQLPTQIIDVRSGTTHFDIKLSNVRTAIAFSCSLRLTKATNAMMELFAQTLAEAANAGKMNGNDLLTFARWIKRSERKVYVWDEPLQFEYQR